MVVRLVWYVQIFLMNLCNMCVYYLLFWLIYQQALPWKLGVNFEHTYINDVTTTNLLFENKACFSISDKFWNNSELKEAHAINASHALLR